MHKFLEHYILGTGYDDLTTIGQKAKAMAKKVIDIGLTPVEEYYGSEITLHYPGFIRWAQQIWYACIMAKKLLLILNNQTDRKNKNG